jgi:DNA-3-methyladenine glycosylase II
LDYYPGLRVAALGNGAEAICTTVLGQLVSVSFGRTLINELMRAAGSKAHHPKTQVIYLFPTAQQIANADLSRVRTSKGRRTTIRALATQIENGSIDWGNQDRRVS